MRTIGRGGRGIPDFGSLARRPRLEWLVDSSPPGLCLLVAPSGFGKSVLAAQLAKRAAGRSYWLDLSRDEMGSLDILRRVLAEIRGVAAEGQDAPHGQPAFRDNQADLVEAIVGQLLMDGSLQGGCLVLDDVRLSTATSLSAIAELSRRAAFEGMTVVATTRALPNGILHELHDVRILEASDLGLRRDECVAVAHALTGRPTEERHVSAIYDLSGGHPAVFAVLVRHAIADADEWSVGTAPSMDLTSWLLRLARLSATHDERLALHAMALLGSGTLWELGLCGAPITTRQLADLADAIPLVRAGGLTSGDHEPSEFRMHDLARNVYCSPEYTDELGGFGDTAWRRAVTVLDARGDVFRAGAVIAAHGSHADIGEWLLRRGDELLIVGGNRLMRRLIAELPVSSFVQYPRLLLVQARLFQEESLLSDAIEKASVAKSIAEHDQDPGLLADSLLLSGQCYLDLGDYAAAVEVLERLTGAGKDSLSASQMAWAYAALGICSVYAGDPQNAISLVEQAKEFVEEDDTDEVVRWFVHTVAGAVFAAVQGDVSSAMHHYASASEVTRVPRYLLAKAKGNLAVALCEMGRLSRSIGAVRDSLAVCLESNAAGNGGAVMTAAFLPVMGAAEVGLGAVETGIRLMQEGIELGLEVSDRYGASYNRIYASTALRSVGRFEEALGEAETALEFFLGAHASAQADLANLELAASLLALGDTAAARRSAQAVRSELPPTNEYNRLRADMILAECERRGGDLDAAVSRLAAHEEFVLTESANWQVAMYCRAFPELLGVFALAMDPDRLPAHLVRMVLPEYSERVLTQSRDFLEPDLWSRLGRRLLGEEGLSDFISRDGRLLCRVRLFGGLEVNVGGRMVAERDWRKRKARLLFTMLVIRRGQDVPRDQLFEYLWPGMDEARAKNNLYVIWSAMKSALMGEADRTAPCPFIESVGGVCRIVREYVVSDVDEFERVMSAAREAEVADDHAAAMRVYDRLSEIYRGDLLPGDVYDDWFADTREHYRVEFTDAMLRASARLMARGEPSAALQFVRRALANDPLREDLYQVALRCQLAAGQRSAAIETYLQCRSRLAEELGLDPSAETRALYDEILAMEERPRSRRYSEDLDALDDVG